MLKFIFCKLLKKHWWENGMRYEMWIEGVDEFYRCRLCRETKIKYMGEDEYII